MLFRSFNASTSNAWVWITTAGWFTSVAVECAWLAQPGIRSQFADSGGDPKTLPGHGFATAVLVFAGVLALGTSIIDLTPNILRR